MIPDELREGGRLFGEWISGVPEQLEKMQPISVRFGIQPLELRSEDGFARIGYSVPKDYCNYMGFVHGGILSTLLDDASGMAAGLLVGAGFKGTASSSISYLAPVRSGDVVVEAQIVRYTKSLLFSEASLFRDGNLCTRGVSTMSYGTRRAKKFEESTEKMDSQ